MSRTMARDLPKSQLMTRTETVDSADWPAGHERSFQGIIPRSSAAVTDVAASLHPENTVRRAARSALLMAWPGEGHGK